MLGAEKCSANHFQNEIMVKIDWQRRFILKEHLVSYNNNNIYSKRLIAMNGNVNDENI